MINDLFKDLINKGIVIVYIDDILIFTEDLQLHKKVVSRVLQILSVRATLHLDKATKGISTTPTIVSKRGEAVSKRVRAVSKRGKIMSKDFTAMSKSTTAMNTTSTA